MNAGPDIERLVASWLIEEAPGRAPDRILANAATRIDRTPQRRFTAWLVAAATWRGIPMSRSVAAAAAAIVVVALVGVPLAVNQLMPEPGATLGVDGCPVARHESDATDTFVEGLPPDERAWRTAGTPPGSSTEPGVIAVFAYELPDAPLAVDSIDPTTGARCRLVTFERAYQVADGANVLEWSPGGDALAIGFDGRLFVWTRGGLLRVWMGDRFPHVAWSPDGSSIAVWNGFDGNDDTGTAGHGVHVIHADGRPDRVFALDPDELGTMELSWSPDGTRWVIGTDSDVGVGSPSALSLVSLSDNAVTPLDLGLPERTYRLVGWPDDEHFIVRASIYGPDPTQYLVVPVADPAGFTTLAVRDVYGASSMWRPEFSPDLTKLGIVHFEENQLAVVDARTGEESTLATSADEFRWAWAPDSRQIVFQTSEGIFTIDAAGTNRRQIATGSLVLLGNPWQAEVSR